MPAPSMSVHKSDEQYTLSFSHRGGLTEVELIELLRQVYQAVNPAAHLNEADVSSEQFQALYNEGPLLFNVMAKDSESGISHSQVGGLTVTEPRFSATVAKLQEFGVEVVE